jgi:chemotaxis signal transduction protein
MSPTFVLFRLGDRGYATALDDVREIARLTGIERLPGTRPPMAGVVVLRGVPLPVYELRSDAHSSDGDVLVLDGPDGPIGVAVHRVTAVVTADELPDSDTPVGALPPYVLGVRRRDGEPVLLVDVHLMLAATGGEPAGEALSKTG